MQRPARQRWPAISAPFALPIGATGMLVVGATASALSGRLSGLDVALLCGLVLLAVASSTSALTTLALAVIGWMTSASFAKPPYGALQPTESQALVSLAVMGAAAGAGLLAAWAFRTVVDETGSARLGGVNRLSGYAAAVDARRRWSAAMLATVALPLVTVLLTGHPLHLSLADDLLIYLLVVIAVAVIGGFWPAVVAAVAAGVFINWYFTKPYHTFTIAEPDNLLALLLFVVVAVTVSSVVHLAARRAQQADKSRAEADALSQLAHTVLSGDDTPATVLHHLQSRVDVGLRLQERVGHGWATVATAGEVSPPAARTLPIRADLRLVLHGVAPGDATRLLEAGGGQAAAALDRDRLRTQAAQAEALAAGNRMRTALLAAVSHDLRTPLASIKASVSSLRQRDVRWSPEDHDALLETVEESTDRLDALIANLLDMSRVQTGALQPYLHPAAVDEIAPVALRALPDGRRVVLDVADDLPLVLTDAGLLERALANLVSNALRYSPPDRPPELVASSREGEVTIRVVDHGPGVAPSERQRMFEPFQRLGDTDASTGVGLGLAVARGFVEAVGGRLTAGDTHGGGLTMTVTLPAVTAASAEERAST